MTLGTAKGIGGGDGEEDRAPEPGEAGYRDPLGSMLPTEVGMAATF